MAQTCLLGLNTNVECGLSFLSRVLSFTGCCSVAQGSGYQFQKQSNPVKTEGRTCGFCRAGWYKWEDIGMGFPLGVMGTGFL